MAQVLVERKVEVVEERVTIVEEEEIVERIEYVDKMVPREVIKEVRIEVPVPGKTVVKRIEEPFDVVREVVVQTVRFT